MENQVPKNIQFRLLSIDEKKFKSDIDEVLANTINDENLKFNLGYSLLPNPDENTLEIEIVTKYLYEDHELLFLSASLTFSFVEFSEVFEIKEGKIQEKVTIIPTLINVAIGTIRGMIATKICGTYLRKFPLPLIDPNVIIHKK